MLKNVNKLQNVEVCAHFISSKYSLTEVGMHYESIQLAQIVRMTIASE